MRSITELSKDRCCGCGGCANICPVKAIQLVVQEDGFSYPKVNADLCINCGKCVRVCPSVNTACFGYMNPVTFAVSSEKSYSEKCSSVGIISMVSEYILSCGGYVCGALYDSDFKVHHVLANDRAVVEKMRKSKYVQSDLEHVFPEIEVLLKKNIKVLFTGTPCQVSALRLFLGQDYQCLYTIDVVCHGVPSPGVWEKYLKENYTLSEIMDIDFRHKAKKEFNASQFLKIDFKDGTVLVKSKTEDLYYIHFLHDFGLRMSCYDCIYREFPRTGDLTIGDFWGAKKVMPDVVDDNKLSVVMANNYTGMQILDAIEKRFLLKKEISNTDALVLNAAKAKRSIPEGRRIFFDNICKGETFNRSVRKSLFPKHYDILLYGHSFSENFGAVLTYYALYAYLKKEGYQVVMTCTPEQYNRKNNLSDFYKNNIDFIQLKKWESSHKNHMADIVLLGSDQVWNYKLFNKTYGMGFFLEEIDDNLKKIAYASSFGFDYLNIYNGYQKAYPAAKSCLKRFDSISVREASGVNICNNDFEVEAVNVLDPVFLLSVDDYSRIADNSTVKYNQPYIATYTLSPSEQFNELSLYISDHLRLPLRNMFVGSGEEFEKKKQMSVDVVCENVSVEDWIRTIRDSEFVVTGSFHCLCFALIFRKKFIVIQKGWAPARIESLLDICNLTERHIKSFDEIKHKEYLLNEDIDYGKVWEKLGFQIDRSRRWLKKELLSPKKISVQDISELGCSRSDICLVGNLYSYFEYIRNHDMDDYLILCCCYGRDFIAGDTVHIIDNEIRRLASIDKQSYLMSNLLKEDYSFVVEGKSIENQVYRKIELKDSAIYTLIEELYKTYCISFDWESNASQGTFKIQLGGKPWDSLTDTIDVTHSNCGHYENIYMITEAAADYFRNSKLLRIRADNLNGDLRIKGLRLYPRAKEREMNDSYYGYSMMYDFSEKKYYACNSSRGSVVCTINSKKMTIEYTHGSYAYSDPITELYIEGDGLRKIITFKKEGLYLLMYSKTMNAFVDVSYLSGIKDDLKILHL